MNTAQGVVEIVNERKGLWSIKLDDGEWYGFYKTKPACSKDDSVSFTYSIRGNFKNADNSSLKVLATEEPAVSGSASSVASNRQMSIELQSARRDAVELMKALVDGGAVKLPQKQADKYDAVLGLVSNLTYELYSWVEEPLDFIQDKAMDAAMTPSDKGEE